MCWVRTHRRRLVFWVSGKSGFGCDFSKAAIRAIAKIVTDCLNSCTQRSGNKPKAVITPAQIGNLDTFCGERDRMLDPVAVSRIINWHTLLAC